RVADVAFHLFNRGIVNQRTLCRPWFQSRGWLEFLYGGGKLFGKYIVNGVLYQKAVGADASLSGVAILGGDRAFDSGIQIRIFENDGRRVTSKLKGELFDRARALGHQNLAD